MDRPANAITTVLITQNEAERIERCVVACRPFSDEILVIDGGSEDDTVAIAERLGCRVLENPWPGYAAQRTFGADHASNDWIFWIDIDEIVDARLAAALREFAEGPPSSHAGVSMLRVNQFLGKWLTAGAEIKVRLYHRGRCHITPVLVHERPVCNGRVVHIPEVIWHYNFTSLREAMTGVNKYTSMEAEAAVAVRRSQPWRFVIRPTLRFLQRYVGFGTFRLGWAGLIYSVQWAYWEFMREAKVFEHEQLGGAEQFDTEATADPAGVRAGPSIKRG